MPLASHVCKPAPDAKKLFDDYGNAPSGILATITSFPEDLQGMLLSFPDVRTYLQEVFSRHNYHQKDFEPRMAEIEKAYPEIHDIDAVAKRARELGNEKHPDPEQAKRAMNDIINIIMQSWRESAELIG